MGPKHGLKFNESISMSNPKEIKAIDGFSRVADGVVVSRATNIQTAMTGNTNFPNPPVDLLALKTAIETFSALIAEALDGSKKVIAQKEQAPVSRYQDVKAARTPRAGDLRRGHVDLSDQRLRGR